VYGPVRTVVWEGWSRKAPPYPDLWHLRDMPTGRHGVRFRGKTGSRGQTYKVTRVTQAV